MGIEICLSIFSNGIIYRNTEIQKYRNTEIQKYGNMEIWKYNYKIHPGAFRASIFSTKCDRIDNNHENNKALFWRASCINIQHET